MTPQHIQNAITIYGAQVVSEVQDVVDISDPDGAYSLFEDMGMFEHAECVAEMYF